MKASDLFKKIIKLEDKQTKIKGIYGIFHLNSEKVYIGSSTNIKKRWSTHKWELKEKRHPNTHFQRIVQKYGVNSFLYGVLEFVEDEKMLCERENYFLLLVDKECRINNKPPKRKGPISEELREKFKKVFKGRKVTEKHKEKVRLGNLGKRGSQNQIDAAKKANTGKIVSDKTRKLLSAAAKNRKKVKQTRKLTKELVYQMRLCAKNGIRGTDIAKKFDINYSTTRSAINGFSWKSAPWP